jgi:hypothetical protein
MLERRTFETFTMVEPSFQQQSLSPVLKPVDTLRQLLDEKSSNSSSEYLMELFEGEDEAGHFSEYQLDGQPDSLQAFVDLFYDCRCYMWINDGAFIRLSSWKGRFPIEYQESRYKLCLKNYWENETVVLLIHASSDEKAAACVDFLAGLHDTHYNTLTLSANEMVPCPLNRYHFEKLLRNTERDHVFLDLMLSADQSRALATSNTKGKLELDNCKCIDGGEGFVDAFSRRRDGESDGQSIAILSFVQNPFDRKNWTRFMYALQENEKCLESLHLQYIEFDQKSCEAVAMATVQIKLSNCQFEDQGAAMIEAVAAQRGPRSLRFLLDRWDSYDALLDIVSDERRESFFMSLRNNTHLECLEISPLIVGNKALRVLADALHDNKGLLELSVLFDDGVSNEGWSELIKAVSSHPSLRTLNLSIRPEMSDFDLEDLDEVVEAGRHRTNAVSEMLLLNKKVETMSCDLDTYDLTDWDARVVPRLDCNRYRSRFLAIQQIGNDIQKRAAVLAEAMACVSAKPWLLMTILFQNQDAIASFVAEKPVLTAPRKRSHSFCIGTC